MENTLEDRLDQMREQPQNGGQAGEPPAVRRPSTIGRAVLITMLVVVVAGAILVMVGQRRTAARERQLDEFRIVLATFAAATEEAEEEGMALRQRFLTSLGELVAAEPGVRIMMAEGTAPRTRDEAWQLGTVHLADVVVWGRATTLGAQTAIEAEITRLESERAASPPDPIHLTAPSAPSQMATAAFTASNVDGSLSLRQTTAEGIHDLCVVLAATQYLEAMGKRQDALRMLETVENADSLYHQGRLLETRVGDPSRALERYRRSLDHDPGHLWSTLRIAEISRRNEQWEQAEQYYHRALALAPDDTGQATTGLAETLANMGRQQEAMATLEHAVAENPGAPWLAAALAREHRRRGEPERAREILTTCISHNDDSEQSSFLHDQLDSLVSWLHRSAPAPGTTNAERLARIQELESPRELGFRHVRELVNLHCATGSFNRALDVVDRAEALHNRRFGSRRVFGWAFILRSIKVALGLADDLELQRDESWIFNPLIADEWRAKVHLLAGHPEQAIPILRSRPDDQVPWWVWGLAHPDPLAVAHIMAGDDVSAVTRLEGWRTGRQSLKDGFLLYLCFARLGQSERASQVLTELSEAARASARADEGDRHEVPVELVIGVISGALIEAEAMAVTPMHWWRMPRRDRWDCDLHFFLGSYQHLFSIRAAAGGHLSRAVKTNRRDTLEWLLARHELDLLKEKMQS